VHRLQKLIKGYWHIRAVYIIISNCQLCVSGAKAEQLFQPGKSHLVIYSTRGRCSNNTECFSWLDPPPRSLSGGAAVLPVKMRTWSEAISRRPPQHSVTHSAAVPRRTVTFFLPLTSAYYDPSFWRRDQEAASLSPYYTCWPSTLYSSTFIKRRAEIGSALVATLAAYAFYPLQLVYLVEERPV